jgi:hypothetical protein
VTRNGPSVGVGVLALRRAELDGHLGGLEVAGAPVAEQHVAGDVRLGVGRIQVGAAGPDDGGDLELVVVLVGARCEWDVVGRAEDGGRVGEVEDRLVVPDRAHLGVEGCVGGDDVVLEGHEVSHRRGFWDGRQQRGVGQREDLPR